MEGCKTDREGGRIRKKRDTQRRGKDDKEEKVDSEELNGVVWKEQGVKSGLNREKRCRFGRALSKRVSEREQSRQGESHKQIDTYKPHSAPWCTTFQNMCVC